MTPYTVNFRKVRRNVDWYYTIGLTTDGTTELDISSATFFMEVKDRLTDELVLELSLGDGLQFTTDGTDGQLTILVDHTVMSAIPVGNYKHDLVIVRSGISETVMEGKVKIVDGVTDL